MKLGASTLAGLPGNLEETLEFIESLGLEYAEIVYQYPHDNMDIDNIASFNLKYSIHAPFNDINIASLNEKSRMNSIDQIKESIDFANKINAEAVVVHPGTTSFLTNKFFLNELYEVANESIAEIGEYGDDSGVLVTIENMPDFSTMIYQNISDLNELLTSLGMYMTLDIGHANHVGYSPDEMIFDSIKHVHVHDNFGDDDSHLTLSEGSIDLKYIINTLEEKNYDGIYILEVNDNDSIKKSYEYMKKNF